MHSTMDHTGQEFVRWIMVTDLPDHHILQTKISGHTLIITGPGQTRRNLETMLAYQETFRAKPMRTTHSFLPIATCICSSHCRGHPGSFPRAIKQACCQLGLIDDMDPFYTWWQRLCPSSNNILLITAVRVDLVFSSIDRAHPSDHHFC